MKSKLNYLTKMSFDRKVKSKWFVIANVLLALMIVVIFNIDSIINLFGGDFDELTKVYVIDNTEYSYDLLKTQLGEIDSEYNSGSSSYELVLSSKTYEEELETIKEKGILIQIDEDEKSVLKFKLVTNNFIDTLDYQIISSALTSTKNAIAISLSNIPQEELDKLYAPLNIERVILNEEQNSSEESTNMIMSTVFPIIILPFFMLVIFLVQMIGAEINDEKTTKGMEIIISNVSPETHFFSKLLSGNLFVLMQGALLIIYGLLGFGIRQLMPGGNVQSGITSEITGMLSGVLETSLGQSLIYILPLTLLLMIITFVAYSLLAGILASVTTNAEDFNQLQTPIMIVLLIGYYLAIMAGMFKGAIFIRILSYVPLISAILSPSLLVIGQIGVIDIVISILLTIGFIYLLIKYGLRIYKIGILNYSSKDLWKKMLKAVKAK